MRKSNEWDFGMVANGHISAHATAYLSRRRPGLPPWILCPTAMCVRQKIDTFTSLTLPKIVVKFASERSHISFYKIGIYDKMMRRLILDWQKYSIFSRRYCARLTGACQASPARCSSFSATNRRGWLPPSGKNSHKHGRFPWNNFGKNETSRKKIIIHLNYNGYGLL